MQAKIKMTKNQNKIDKLISKLCPNGVEFKELGEVGTLIRGNGLQKKDFTETGVGCIHYGQIYTYYRSFADKTKSFVSPELAKKLKKAQKGDAIITLAIQEYPAVLATLLPKNQTIKDVMSFEKFKETKKKNILSVIIKRKNAFVTMRSLFFLLIFLFTFFY